MRYPVAASADQAIERAASGYQRGPAFGGNDDVDQRIDRRIGNAGEVVRALERRRLRGKERAQRIARRRGEAEPVDGDVEIEAVAAGAVLYRIDDAQARLDAEDAEILDERRVMRLEGRLVNQELDGHGLAARQNELAVLDRATGLLDELRGLAQQRAILAGAVGDRRLVRLAEDLLRQVGAERLEQSKLRRVRHSLRHHVRVLKDRDGPLVRPVHDRLVRPFEVEGVTQRLAQARIGEFRASRIDEPTLRARRRVVRQRVLLDAA